MSLLSEGSGEFRFRDFVRDERAMAKLFESFVFNFYKVERPELQLRKERIYWQANSESDPEFRFLPTMETDISIRNRPHTKTLIIDTKFYKDTFQRNYDREKVHSANLYQLVAYLRNLQFRDGPDSVAKGMLLYPVIDKSARLTYNLAGHDVSICTINLGAQWKEIRDELQSLVEIV